MLKPGVRRIKSDYNKKKTDREIKDKRIPKERIR